MRWEANPILTLKMKLMRNPLLPKSNEDNASLIIYFALAMVFFIVICFLVFGGR